MIGQQKNLFEISGQQKSLREFYITKTTIWQKNLWSLFKIQMHNGIILELCEKYKCTGIAILL